MRTTDSTAPSSATRRSRVVILLALLGLPLACTSGQNAGEALPGVVVTELQSGVRASLRGLHVVSASVAFVSGTGGTLLRTTDAGRSWQPLVIAGAQRLDFRSVAARTSTAIVVASAGRPARVYRSLDGERFDLVHEDEHEGAFFDSVALGVDEDLWLFGDPQDGAFVLRRGLRFGTTFVDHGHRLPTPRPGEAGFAASNACLEVDAAGAALIVTTGATAAPRFLRYDPEAPIAARVLATDLPLAHGKASRGAFAVARDETAIVVVGGDYQAPDAREGCGAYSHDGGKSFTVARGLRGYRSGVSAVPGRPGTFVAIGPLGAEISQDGGRTFVPLPELRGNAVTFAGAGIGYACGSDGRVYRVLLPAGDAAD